LKTKGYKKMALIAEDYAFPYSQVQGFMTEYCKAGAGSPKAWVPLAARTTPPSSPSSPATWTRSWWSSAARTR